MLPSGDSGGLRDSRHSESDGNETGKENIKKRKRASNVKNGSRVSNDHDLRDFLPRKKLNMETELENIEEENNKMSDSPNRVGFSSFSNHVNERSPLASSKPTQTKKLVIKNFKGLYQYIETAHYIWRASVL